MTDKRTIITISIIVVFILGVCFLFSKLFSGKPSNSDELNKQLLAAKDSVIASKNENIGLHERILEERDKTSEILHEKDSASEAHSKQIELNYIKLNETLRNIPNRINRIANNPDSIARAFADF